MNYKLIAETTGNKPVRTYRNDQGAETKTTLIYTDSAGGQWWGFVDLLKIPYLRIAYAQNITNLFTVGLSLNDVLRWAKEHRDILKSEDPERVERSIALTYEIEKTAKHIADPVIQHLSLATVYVLGPDEAVDQYDEAEALKKLALWKADKRSVSFFLNWLTGHTQNYLGRLEKISRTVLPLVNNNRPIPSPKK